MRPYTFSLPRIPRGRGFVNELLNDGSFLDAVDAGSFFILKRRFYKAPFMIPDDKNPLFTVVLIAGIFKR
jgi:hypothetical protein